MNIRPIEKKDIAACATILRQVYNNEQWMCRWDVSRSEAYLQDFFQAGKFLGFVCEQSDSILGALFAHQKVWWNADEVFVDEMFIAPEHQRNGLGTALLRRLEQEVRSLGLAGMTLTTNRFTPAPAFYQKNGFARADHVVYMYKVTEGELTDER